MAPCTWRTRAPSARRWRATAPSDHDATVVAYSRDHGKTWTNEQVGQNYDFPYNADVANETLTGENFRINSYPQLTVDPVTQHLYVTWADDRNGPVQLQRACR